MEILFKNSGRPKHKFVEEPCQTVCATCGVDINQGVTTGSLVGDAFSRQSEFVSFSNHVCRACAWMYSYPKETHRNVIAIGANVYWPMISHDSATEERPSWLQILSMAPSYSGDAPVFGVMTTDPKPRLWPMSRQTTVDHFGLYVHCPDYDVSEFRYFSLERCLLIADIISQRMEDGYSKRACFFGLLNDIKKAKKDPIGTVRKEQYLKPLRQEAAFVPGMLAAGKRK